ncbi:UNVERIFIED_CONTAM: hypothetical protein RMT77_009452 [Armadillidium vulgare]
MRVITVYGWNIVRQSKTPTEKYALNETVTERSIIVAECTYLDCSCDVNYLHSAYLKGKENIIFGEAFSAIDRSIELALSCIKENEETIIQIHILGKYIHENVCEDIVKIKCKLVYKILKRATKIYELNNRNKLDICRACKDNVVEKYLLYKSNNSSYLFPLHMSVLVLLVRAVKWLSMISIDSLCQADKESYDVLKIQCYNNISYFHLIIGNNEKAATAASVVIHHIPNNTKALFRRAVANTNLQNYESACTDLKIIIKNEPSNNRAKAQLELVSEKIKSLDDVYAKAMKRFLNLK